MLDRDASILITGATGMVGSNLYKKMVLDGYRNLIAPGIDHKRVDLTNSDEVYSLFAETLPDYVFMLAAKVGGIKANVEKPVEFLQTNLLININLFTNCYQFNVQKSLYLGSSCIYPKDCSQPMKEEYLMTGPLEPTNEGYALAKIAGLKLAEFYYNQYKMKTVCLMPCNIYGTGDHYDDENAHVLSSLISRIYNAKINDLPEVEVWGNGFPRREFIHVNDVVDAMLYFIENRDTPDFINIGTGVDLRILDLAELIKREIDYKGIIRWNIDKPNGMMKKCLDITKMEAAGFRTKIDLISGIKQSLKEYKLLKS